jgi:hypothetical protein
MVSKKNWLGILAILLVFGMVFLGCPNDTISPNNAAGTTDTSDTDETTDTTGTDDTTGDTWSNVTNFDQLDGTWRGSYSKSTTMEEIMTEDETWTDSSEAIFGDMSITISMDITSTFNVTDKTSAMSATITETYSGGNIEAMWPMMKQGLEGLAEVPEIEFNDTTHSIIMTENQPVTPISDEDIAEMLDSGLKINQNGTKIKMPSNMIEGDSPEIIMVKQ